MTKDARREQLLQAAGELLAAQGADSFSMDRLAAQAGVNKALPYRHFDNADAVMTELLRRYNETMVARVLGGMARSEGAEAKVRAAVGAFFDVVEEHGAVVTELIRWSPSGAPGLGRVRTGEQFLADVLVAELEVPREAALTAASVILGALIAAVESCGLGESSRPFAERLAVESSLAVLTVARS